MHRDTEVSLQFPMPSTTQIEPPNFRHNCLIPLIRRYGFTRCFPLYGSYLCQTVFQHDWPKGQNLRDWLSLPIHPPGSHRPPFKTRPGRWHLRGENGGSSASVVKGRTSFGLTLPWDKGEPQCKELDRYYGVHYGLLSLLGRRREGVVVLQFCF